MWQLEWSQAFPRLLNGTALKNTRIFNNFYSQWFNNIVIFTWKLQNKSLSEIVVFWADDIVYILYTDNDKIIAYLCNLQAHKQWPGHDSLLIGQYNVKTNPNEQFYGS